jgi:hypothetical protein
MRSFGQPKDFPRSSLILYRNNYRSGLVFAIEIPGDRVIPLEFIMQWVTFWLRLFDKHPRGDVAVLLFDTPKFFLYR